MDRVKSGVPGFDDLVSGGFPKGFAVLLSGAPGTGKTIFGLHFLLEGLRDSQSCGYVTYSQSRQDILDQAAEFGWNLGAVDFLEIKSEEFEEVLGSKRFDRLIVDSLSSVAVMTRDSLSRFIKRVKEMGCTALLISELPQSSEWFSRDTISEFLCDGVIVLRSVEAAGEVKNLLKVEKMRSTRIDQKSHMYDIAQKGLVVKTYKAK